MSDVTSTTPVSAEQARTLIEQAQQAVNSLGNFVEQASVQLAEQATASSPFFVQGLTIFVLAVFVGYYVVWRVTPALHSPLMAVTNAVSSVIIVGAVIAAGPATFGFSSFMGVLGVLLASINIFGGFIVTQRMLQMYKKKAK